MRDSMTTVGWVGGAMLISVCLLVLCQHAEGERTRAAMHATQARVDKRIRVLDARLTDMQAETNRKKLANMANPPLDPKRLAKASKELEQLIAERPAPPPIDVQQPLVPPPAGAPATLSSSVQARVRVCQGGRWYHRPGCKRVKKHTMPITAADAEAQGWRACPTCKP
jgi:hypothetical protein